MISPKTAVLTFWQPWAWLIVAGFKDVENRLWSTRYRGTLFIHVGRHWHAADVDQQLDELVGRGLLPSAKRPTLATLREQLGSVIGRAKVTGCALTKEPYSHPSPWATHEGFAWELSDAELISPAVPILGKRGLFPAPAELLVALS